MNLTPKEIQKYLASMKHGEASEMARALGMHRQSISLMKHSKKFNPTWETIEKISRYKESKECSKR